MFHNQILNWEEEKYVSGVLRIVTKIRQIFTSLAAETGILVASASELL